MSGARMKKAGTRKARTTRSAGRDTMRPEYDFSKGTRGTTADRYAKGTNVVVIDPDLLDLFPDGQSVNEALRALASVARRQKRRRRSA